MDWTTEKEIPSDIAKYVSVDRENGEISSITFSIEGCQPFRIIGHDYTRAVKLLTPTPPKDVEVFKVIQGDIVYPFHRRSNASRLADALGVDVTEVTMKETEAAKITFCDVGDADTPDSDILF